MDQENTEKPEEGAENTIPDDEAVGKEGMSENEIVVLILGVTVVGLLVFAFYIYSNRRYYGIGLSSGPRAQNRNLSQERDAYSKAKASLDISDPAQMEELKKHLMRRAMFTIPMILDLQQQGKSVDRLYGRGMLTDEIMDNVKYVKAFVDAEFPDVQAEADDMIPGWGPAIWQEAMQFHKMVQQRQAGAPPAGGAGGPKGRGVESGPLNRDAKDKKAAAAERRRKNAASLQMSPAELMKKKEAEAERVAAQLLQEEEREKEKKKKK